MTYYWRNKTRLPERWGEACEVIHFEPGNSQKAVVRFGDGVEVECRRRVRFGRHLTVQHVIRGVRRSDEWCCLLVYCWQCHRLADDGFRIPMAGGKYWPSLSLGAQLTIKQETDPEDWNPARLAELYRQTLPELEPIPEEFLKERDKWK